MDLATARTRATISVPEAGELLSLGRDASYASAARGEIPTLAFGRRLRVPVALLLARLGEPLEHLRPVVPDGALDPETTQDAEAGPSTGPATATIHAFARPKTGDPHGAESRHLTSTSRPAEARVDRGPGPHRPHA